MGVYYRARGHVDIKTVSPRLAGRLRWIGVMIHGQWLNGDTVRMCRLSRQSIAAIPIGDDLYKILVKNDEGAYTYKDVYPDPSDTRMLVEVIRNLCLESSVVMVVRIRRMRKGNWYQRVFECLMPICKQDWWEISNWGLKKLKSEILDPETGEFSKKPLARVHWICHYRKPRRANAASS